ncbi:MAG: RagB/SusD family nutrient uptake outer membrane protein [Saprospiraceae bacterium]
MKKILLLILLNSLLFLSCSEDYLLLENPNQLDSANFFQTEEDIQIAITSAYAELQNFPTIFYLYLKDGRSNNYFSGTSNAQRDLVDISSFNVTSELRTLDNAWRFAYSLIARTNKVLSVIDDVPFSSETLRDRIKGEARFLRGFAHFELTRTFGKVPIIDDLVSPEKALEIGRSELTDVYAFIETDLQFALANLPTTYPSTELGKATQYAAAGLLAKVYLTWGQFPVEDKSKVDLAVPILESLITNDNSLNWSFNYKNIFKSSNDNKYCLFEVQYISGANGIGALFPSEFLTSSLKAFPFSGGIPRITPSRDLLSAFDMEADIRFNATFDTTYVDNFGFTVNDDLITKWFETGLSLLNRGDWPHNYPILRPADIYLMYAEALIIKEGNPTTTSIDALNKTRRRAGLLPINPDSRAAFEEALKLEYRREFVGEGVYWPYLVRSGQAVEDMNTWLMETEQNYTINTDKLIYPIPFSQMVIKAGLYTQNPGY